MKAKFKQWGALLIVFGVASLILPLIGIQLRVFNLFGEAQRTVGIASIALGTVLWFIGKSREKSFGEFAHATPTPTGAGVPPLPSAPASSAAGLITCPTCGAKASASDRFCIECGNALPQVTAAPPVTSATPPRRHKKRMGLKIVLVLLLLFAGAIAWFFFGPSKPYQPPANRSEPGVPPRLAGTLTEFPVDSATTNQLKPGNVVSQSFEPAAAAPGTSTGSTLPPPPVLGSGAPTTSTQTTQATSTVQAPPNTFPPGLNPATIPQQATAMTSCTYRIDPVSPPVHAHVLHVGDNLAVVVEFARAIAQALGGLMEQARVQSPQGQIYDGFNISSATNQIYVLNNAAAGNVVILYAPQPESFPAVQRLASNVGNGRGLYDYPQVIDTYAALPASPPPGYRLIEMRGFTGGELNVALGNAQGQVGGDSAALKRMLETVRVFIPERGTTAVYDNGQGQEKGVLVGNYGSPRKARVAWRTLAWTFGWGMEKNKQLGVDALINSDQESRFMLFQKGPYIGMTRVPATSSEQELLDLAASLQF